MNFKSIQIFIGLLIFFFYAKMVTITRTYAQEKSYATKHNKKEHMHILLISLFWNDLNIYIIHNLVFNNYIKMIK